MSGGRTFELRRKLGEGTFGTVYLADMTSLGGFRKRVAIKVLNSNWDPASEAGRRLRDEARLLGRLRHKHIVRVDDLVRVDGRWAVVMEALPGADLDRVISVAIAAKERFPLKAALEITAAVASALHAAMYDPVDEGSPLQVVHRDIKPSNLVLGPDGDLKVLDFGIARAELDNREASTERVRFGSVPYMSPERLLGEDSREAGDVYSVGVVLYESLTCEPYGRAELAPSKAEAQLDEALQKLSEVLGEDGVGPEAVALIRDAMAYDQESRPGFAQLRDRARALLDRATGENLAGLAARLVPPAVEQNRMEQETASGALEEERTPSVGYSSGANRPPTLIPSDPESFGLAEDSGLQADPPRYFLPAPVAPPAPPEPEPEEPAPPTLEMPPPALMEASEPPPRRAGVALWAIPALILVVLAAWLFWPVSPATVEPAVPAPQVTPPVERQPVKVRPPEPAPPPTPEEAPPPSPATSDPAKAAKAPPRSTPRAQPLVEPPVVEAPPPSVSEADRIRAIKIAAPAATSVQASCSDKSGAGSSSVLLREVLPGSCTITAVIEGTTYASTVQVKDPGGFNCTLQGESLSCQ